MAYRVPMNVPANETESCYECCHDYWWHKPRNGAATNTLCCRIKSCQCWWFALEDGKERIPVDSRDEQIRRLELKMEHLAAAIAKLKEPEFKEPEGDNPVITFTRTFSRETYHYAAIKARGKWWLTGSHTMPLTWNGILKYVGPEDVKTIIVPGCWDSPWANG